MACMMKILIFGWIVYRRLHMSLLAEDPVTKSIQKTRLSDKERDGTAGSNNMADKEKFVLLSKWKYKVVGRKNFRRKK